MTTINTQTTLTLSEMKQRVGDNGALKDIIDVIRMKVPMLDHAVFQECNKGSYHEITTRSRRPTGDYRAFNQGVAAEASATDVAVEPVSMFAGLSEVDARLLEQNGGLSARLDEDQEYMRGMATTIASDIFNADRTSDPRKPNGIYLRSDYNDLTSSYVIDNAGGKASVTANKSSIVAVNWGKRRCTLLYPRGGAPGQGMFGIRIDDFGKYLATDGAGKKYPVYGTWLDYNWGLCVEDPGAVFRLVNISNTAIDGVDDFSIDEDKLIDMDIAMKQIFPDGWRYYCNAAVLAQVWKRAKNIDKGGGFVTQPDPFGRPVAAFNGTPFYGTTALTQTEATVS